MTRDKLALAAALASALLLAACEVGPDFTRPAAPAAAGYAPAPLAEKTASAPVAAGEAQRIVADLDIPGQWWTLFHSEPLNRLIDDALKTNPSLEAAAAALREAKENVYAQEGSFFPTVSAGGSATREKISGASFGLPGESGVLGLTTATLNVSYALDVFGGLRRQAESLEAQAEYQRFELEATYLSLTANLVVAAVTEASLRGQIAATQDIIRIEGDQLGVVRRQLTLGGASKADVLQQEAALAATQAALPPLQKQLAQERNALAALAGRFPNDDGPAKFELASLALPRDLPLSLPAKLVEQRPDVRAAEAELHAASAAIGVAAANQLPQFNLSGQIGTSSLGFDKLFSPGTGIWSLGGSVAETLFDAGTLAHKKRAAVAAFDQAAAQYRSTVLAAFQNVADALRALASDADAVKAEAEAERSAKDSLALAQSQYQLGAVNYLTLLNAEHTYQQALINLVAAQASRFSDTAALFQALGGGWWNRSDVPASANAAPGLFLLPPLGFDNP